MSDQACRHGHHECKLCSSQGSSPLFDEARSAAFQFEVKLNKWAKPGLIYLLGQTLLIAPQDWDLGLDHLGKLPVKDLGPLNFTGVYEPRWAQSSSRSFLGPWT